jgi:hypothetical protein
MAAHQLSNGNATWNGAETHAVARLEGGLEATTARKWPHQKLARDGLCLYRTM